MYTMWAEYYIRGMQSEVSAGVVYRDVEKTAIKSWI